MTKAEIIQKLTQLGASLDDDFTFATRSEKSFMADAPDGYQWAATEASTLTVIWFDGTASEFWTEVGDLIADGLVES